MVPAARWPSTTLCTRLALVTRCSVFRSRADWTPEPSSSPDWFEKLFSVESTTGKIRSGWIESILSLPDQEDHCGQYATGSVRGDAGGGTGHHAGLRPGHTRLRGDRVQLREHGDFVRVAGRARCRRPLGRDPRCRGSLPDPVRGALAQG